MAQIQPAAAFLAMQDVSYVRVADETGVNVETVRRTMRGKTRPNPAVVDWCVRRFGVPAEVLFRQPAGGVTVGVVGGGR